MREIPKGKLLNFKNGVKRRGAAPSRVRVAYWLVPAPAERELFQTIIKILARELQAPLFEPHLTLFSTSLEGALSSRVWQETKAAPRKLRIRGVRFSALFTKTLFIRFAKGAALDQLAARLQRKCGARVSPVADPHLSLCYKHLPAATRKRLAAMIRLPLQEVVFDTLKVVRCASPTRTAADVAAWRVLARQKLGRLKKKTG